MKTTLSLTLLLFLWVGSTTLQAQPHQGDILSLSSGTIGLEPFSDSTGTVRAVISPGVGWAVTDHWVVGFSTGFEAVVQYGFPDRYPLVRTRVSVGPSISYYGGEGPWRPFGTVGVEARLDTRYPGDFDILLYPLWDMRVRLRGGMPYWVNQQFAIVPELFYTLGYSWLRQIATGVSHEYGASLGVRYIWSRRK